MPETTRVTAGGRIVIPVHYRRELGIHTGDEVIVHLDDGELHIYTLQRAIERAQRIVRAHVPDGVSLADELIQDRRAEAR
ncbi:MAG: AbrB/MazE/SpoVT family DNA-binding domain-containing protein [Ktedonobacterales bacterium]